MTRRNWFALIGAAIVGKTMPTVYAMPDYLAHPGHWLLLKPTGGWGPNVLIRRRVWINKQPFKVVEHYRHGLSLRPV